MKNQSNLIPQKTNVLIVGAGPSGLMTANFLQKFDVDFIIVDYKSGPTVESRALAVSARSMEVYQQLGLDKQVLAEATKVNGFQIYSNGKIKAEMNTSAIGEGLSEFDNMMTIFEQNKNETLLYKNLKSLGAEVFWETKFESFKINKEAVDITLTHAGEELTVSVKYIIGCDGASSKVRHSGNFTFKGGTYENKFFVADVIIQSKFEANRIILAPADNIFSAFFPMKGIGSYRLVGSLPEKYVDQDIDFNTIKDTVKKYSRLDVEYEKVNWFSVYKLHHRAVNNFREGRIFLVGDSAHIHSPAGGQGMNTGLQDAHNLAWKMAYVLKGFANEKLLDTYNEERMPFAKWVLGFTDRGFTVLASKKWYLVLFRKYIVLNLIGIVTKFRFVLKNGFQVISQIWVNYKGLSLAKSKDTKQKLKFEVGDRFPYFKKNGFALFSNPCFYVVKIGESISNDEQEKLSKLTFPIEFKSIALNTAWRKLGVSKTTYILVRPDMFIGLIMDKFSFEKIESYLK